MFENMKLLETELGQEILQEDLTILARFINEQRRIQGKSDEIKMNQTRIKRELKMASDIKSTLPPQAKPSTSIKKMLDEVVYHQKRKGINFGEVGGKASKNLAQKEEVVGSALFEEETIPNHCKPYM